MRAGVLLLPLIGCSQAEPVAEGIAVPCVLDGGASEECRLAETGDGRFVLHHPDGGFRVLILSDGRYETAAGADRAVNYDGGVMVADDHYRLTAP